MKRKRVAIIGTGPSGLAVAEEIVTSSQHNRELEVTLVGPEYSGNLLPKRLEKKMSRLKTVFGSYFPYDIDNFLRSEQSKGVNVFPSGANGGFSNVWGAALGHEPRVDFFGNFLTDSKEILSKVFVKSIANSQSQYLATNLSLCNFCGQCLDGCPKGAIWSSVDSINQLVSKGLVARLNGYVDSIELEGEQVKIKLLEGNPEFFNYVFLCCGPISTVSLLLRSRFSTSPVFLKDTRMVKVVGLRRPRKYEKASFALSTRSFYLGNPKQVSPIGHLQIYDDVRGLWYRFSWLRKLFIYKNLFDFFAKFFCVSLLYLDSVSSSHLRLSIQATSVTRIEGCKVDGELASLIRAIGKLVCSVGRLGFIPMFAWRAKIGESFHVGSAYGPATIESLHHDPKIQDRIYVCDATNLKEIPLGNFTPAIVEHAREVTRLFLSKS